MNSSLPDTEYIILEKVYVSTEHQLPLRQRDLAQIAGTSLGMTNSILKRLARKGWITAKKLNSRNIQYAVTLDGMNEIIHRSYGYFKRTIKNVVFYKDRIDDTINSAKRRNITTVLLIGSSDLDFIVEHACLHHGLSFFKIADENALGDLLKENVLAVYAETIPLFQTPAKKNAFFLSRVVIEKTAEPALALV
jgi:predicted transcriptional regulator